MKHVAVQCDAQSHFAMVDGAKMHYVRAGSGPAMVLLHGLMGSVCTWRRNIAELAEHFTVYAIDWIGMGASDRVAGLDASMLATADRLLGFMDSVGIDRATIVAHSHSGAVAMLFATIYPERMRALALAAPANPYSEASHRIIRFYRSRFGRVFAHVVPHLPRFMQRAALVRMYGNPERIADGVLEGYINGLRVPGTTAHVMKVLETWGADMLQLRLALKREPAQRMPTLMMWGDLDRAVPLESGVRLRKRLRQSKLVILEGVGHLPFEEVPERANAILLEWVREQGLDREERREPVRAMRATQQVATA
jgi:pimeloyl-ACP methyl ester carboxylesterase